LWYTIASALNDRTQPGDYTHIDHRHQKHNAQDVRLQLIAVNAAAMIKGLSNQREIRHDYALASTMGRIFSVLIQISGQELTAAISPGTAFTLEKLLKEADLLDVLSFLQAVLATDDAFGKMSSEYDSVLTVEIYLLSVVCCLLSRDLS
jgi:hypothetical protein